MISNNMENFSKTELENEKWKDIEGYDGAYQVSDLGRVRSLKFGKVRVLRAYKRDSGYLQLTLSKHNKIKRFSVHRLVAQAFIPNYDDSKNEVNHINELKSDNRAVNLEWCTAQYNSTYNDIQFRKENSKRRKIKELYDPNLSIQKNLEIFRSNGVECCKETVVRLRKDLCLTRQRNIRHKLKGVYDPNLTYEQNIEVFRANGIECTRDTVIQLRKDLKLKHRPNYKLNKIKPLYRPELSIKQNIEIFKANGIECSSDTVIKLRKDLGLTKKTIK